MPIVVQTRTTQGADTVTLKNNSIHSTAAPLWPKIGNVSISYSHKHARCLLRNNIQNVLIISSSSAVRTLNGLSFHARHRGGGWSWGSAWSCVRRAQNSGFSSRHWAQYLLHKPVSRIHSSPVAAEPGEGEKRAAAKLLKGGLTDDDWCTV